MIRDFMISAWPWIVLGLVMSILATYVLKVQKQGKQRTSRAWFVAAMLAYSSVFMTYLADGTIRGTGVTWLCLGSAFLCLGAASANKEKDEQDDENKDDHE